MYESALLYAGGDYLANGESQAAVECPEDLNDALERLSTEVASRHSTPSITNHEVKGRSTANEDEQSAGL